MNTHADVSTERVLLFQYAPEGNRVEFITCDYLRANEYQVSAVPRRTTLCGFGDTIQTYHDKHHREIVFAGVIARSPRYRTWIVQTERYGDPVFIKAFKAIEALPGVFSAWLPSSTGAPSSGGIVAPIDAFAQTKQLIEDMETRGAWSIVSLIGPNAAAA